MTRFTLAQNFRTNALFTKIALLVLAASASLVGCGGGDSAPDQTDSQFIASFIRNRSQPLGTGVSGRVISAVSGTAISGATITANGVSTTSDSDGNYNLNVPAATRILVTIAATNFAASIKVVSVTANRSTPLTAQLLPIGANQSVPVATGGTVSVTGTQALVTIPAACLVPVHQGAATATDVSISVTAIPPATDVNLMSGEYVADASGTFTPIESFGAVLVSARDSSGEPYSLGTGCSATIQIPVSTRVSVAPSSSPLFALDEGTGRWIQNGTGTLTGTAPNQYYAGTINQLGYWNADLSMSTVNVTGCVNDRNTGQPIANALITGDGINYSSLTTTRTAQDGTFTLPIKLNGSATIVGLSGTNLTNTVVAGPSATNIALPTCLLGVEGFGFNARLTWGASPSDIDTHLLAPDGTHVYYASKGSLSAAPFAALDVDDTTGFGPEVLTTQRLYVGTYRYFLHNFSNTFSPGMTGSPVRVELNFGNSLDVFTPPPGEGSNRYWHIFDLQVDPVCNVTVTTVNQWLTSAPPPITSATPTLCTG